MCLWKINGATRLVDAQPTSENRRKKRTQMSNQNDEAIDNGQTELMNKYKNGTFRITWLARFIKSKILEIFQNYVNFKA